MAKKKTFWKKTGKILKKVRSATWSGVKKGAIAFDKAVDGGYKWNSNKQYSGRGCAKCGRNSYGKPLCYSCWKQSRGYY